jgi:hypothetical protein
MMLWPERFLKARGSSEPLPGRDHGNALPQQVLGSPRDRVEKPTPGLGGIGGRDKMRSTEPRASASGRQPRANVTSDSLTLAVPCNAAVEKVWPATGSKNRRRRFPRRDSRAVWKKPPERRLQPGLAAPLHLPSAVAMVFDHSKNTVFCASRSRHQESAWKNSSFAATTRICGK